MFGGKQSKPELTWEDKLDKCKKFSEEVNGKFRVEEFADGNKRILVEVRK